MKNEIIEKDCVVRLTEKYLSGTITPSEHASLKHWIGISDENHRYFDELREKMLAGQLVSGKIHFDTATAFDRFCLTLAREERKKRHIWGQMPVGWAVAAMIALLIITAAGTYMMTITQQEKKETLAYHEIVVPAGGRSKILLPDGSTVFLNAQTTLRYSSQYGEKNRELWLEGEGYFVVEKNKGEFLVHSHKTTVKALGTEFNVKAYPDENVVEATLVKGKIAVRQQYGDNKESEDIILLPNEKLIITDGNVLRESVENGSQPTSVSQTLSIHKKKDVDLLQDIAWKDNRLVIVRKELGALAIDLERKYDVEIEFADPKVACIPYSGTLEDESLEQVLDAMTVISPIRYSIQGKKVTIQSK